ncbi:SOS response-associated peptidase [Dorea sp. D27]|nr:SOS response-associated peptidase [Dorea sp. D27]
MTDAILSIFDVHNRMPVILPKDKVEDWLMTEEFEALKGTE